MAPYKARYGTDANDIFRLESVEDLKPDILGGFIEEFISKQLPRLDVLQQYYLNNTRIKTRPNNDPNRADNRLSHNFARYISTVVQGYMLGNPIRYKHKNQPTLEQVEEFVKTNNEHAHNSIMEMNLSIYGRAFELVYRDEEAVERVAAIDPKEAFVIYDLTVAFRPLAGVHFFELTIGKNTTFHAHVYTEEGVLRYKGKSWKKLAIEDEEENYFGGVTLIEYWNNDDRVGDFEPVLDLIDAYDIAQSDTANEIEDFASAYLVLQGQPNTDSEDVNDMKKTRVIVLDQSPDGQKPAAYYLTKQYDVAGQEAMKNRLVNDIHKLSFVPDLSDEQFSSNVSGEAMKYKLFVFDQLRTTKERLFKDGLMQRFRLIANSWDIRSKEGGVEDLEIAFNPNLPKNTKELVEIATMLEGVVSKETQLNLLPMVENVQDELDRMEEEEERLREEDEDPYPNANTNVNANNDPTRGEGEA